MKDQAMSERFIDVKLADDSHHLPLPGSSALFPKEGLRVDSWDGFWLQLLADGSIVPASPVVSGPSPFAATPAPEHHE